MGSAKSEIELSLSGAIVTDVFNGYSYGATHLVEETVNCDDHTAAAEALGEGLADLLIGLVAKATPSERIAMLTAAGDAFVKAVESEREILTHGIGD